MKKISKQNAEPIDGKVVFMKKDIFKHKPYKNEYSDDDKLKFKKPIYVKDDLETLMDFLNNRNNLLHQ